MPSCGNGRPRRALGIAQNAFSGYGVEDAVVTALVLAVPRTRASVSLSGRFRLCAIGARMRFWRRAGSRGALARHPLNRKRAIRIRPRRPCSVRPREAFWR